MAREFIRPGQRDLDEACGIGNWLTVVCDEGGIPSGIDISPNSIEICKQLIPNGEFHSGPAESLPSNNNTFDLISCLCSLEDFLDPVSAIKEMVRGAREGALFIILAPNSGLLRQK